MVKQRLFLGSVAFGISFGISFLTSRNLGTAIASGVTTTVATVAASVLVDRAADRPAQLRIADLNNHIQALQQRRAEAYQAYVQLEAEKEQLATHLHTLTFEPSQRTGQSMMMGASAPRMLPASRKVISWNLSAPVAPTPSDDDRPSMRPYELPTEIPAAHAVGHTPVWGRSDTEISPQILSDAAATKQKIETSLTALQGELRQLKGQITDHRQTREKLSRDVVNVREEKRQLEAAAKILKGEVQALETCRVELEQFLVDATVKKQELETGSHPLQEALNALQTQVSSLQEELHGLEAQILDRRSQKEALEKELAALNALHNLTQSGSLKPSHLPPPAPNAKNGDSLNGSNGNSPAATPTTTTIALQETPTKRLPPLVKPTRSLKTGSTQPRTAVLPELIPVDNASSDLPLEWTEFMVQLPEYELQVLQVIVGQTNPAAVLKQIAEANLTMPELLIDSINERALDTIGDLLIDASAGAGSAVVVREHLKTVKKLLKTYEYLVN